MRPASRTLATDWLRTEPRRAAARRALDDHRDALRKHPAIDLRDQTRALRHRHQFGCDVLAAVIALQAKQRLELFALLAVQRDDRLEQDLQARAVQREPDLPRNLGIVGRVGIVHEENAVAAFRARLGEGCFRRVEHGQRITAAVAERAHASVEHEPRGALCRGERLARETIADVRGITFERGDFAIRIEQQETRIAFARDEIPWTGMAGQELPDLRRAADRCGFHQGERATRCRPRARTRAIRRRA